MPGILTHAPVSDEQRQANDRHRVLPVVAVLAVLCLYVYLFTQAFQVLHLPAPQDLLDGLRLPADLVFDEDRNVESRLRISMTFRFDSDDERLILFLSLVPAFLCAYYLPLRYKHLSLVLWSIAAITVLYGVRGTAGLLFGHSVVYLALHPPPGRRWILASLPGILGYFALARALPRSPGQFLALVLVTLLSAVLYRYGVLRLLSVPRAAGVFRALVIQSPSLTVFASAMIEGMHGRTWVFVIGLLLFFWQWERLILYHVDYKDGLIPAHVPPIKYLVVFFTPGVIPMWHRAATIAQGYSYTHDNFLCEDKNKIVLGGVKILMLALGYLVFDQLIRVLLVECFSLLGVRVYNGRIYYMVEAFMKREYVSTPSVLITSLLEVIGWYLLSGGIVHFKVGVWRICGFRIDPYFDKPWLSTNLVTLWSRFTFHYREFLVRAFYYPVFFALFRRNRHVRIVAATLAAATVGNLFWGHLTPVMYELGMEFDNFEYLLVTWPYFVLLGVGISVAELHLSRRRRMGRTRKPWTWGPRIVLDVIAAYCTFQFYSIIHIFLRPAADATAWDLFRLFLIGFGIRI